MAEEIVTVDPLKGKSAVELGALMAAKGESLKAQFAAKVIEVDGEKKFDMTIPEIEEYRKGHQELNDIGKRWESMRAIEGIAAKSNDYLDRVNQVVNPVRFGGAAIEQPMTKSLGEVFVSSKVYQDRKATGNLNFVDGRWGIEIPGVSLKTTMSIGTGFASANDRSDVVIPKALRQPVLQDYLPSLDVSVDSYKYMEETTNTNNVAAAAEAAAIGESALAFTERTVVVELIGGFLPVTEQQLEIEEGIMQTINTRLMDQLLRSEETEIINGDTSSPNLVGFYNVTGLQTQAVGALSKHDAVYEAITKIRVTGFAEPDLCIFHPNDWKDIRLTTDANGNYLWGNPAEAGNERIWGKPVLQTTAATENTGLVGAFAQYSTLVRKRGARIEVGYQNDDFVKNLKTIKITSRLANVIYRAAAFCSVTSL